MPPGSPHPPPREAIHIHTYIYIYVFSFTVKENTYNYVDLIFCPWVTCPWLEIRAGNYLFVRGVRDEILEKIFICPPCPWQGLGYLIRDLATDSTVGLAGYPF